MTLLCVTDFPQCHEILDAGSVIAGYVKDKNSIDISEPKIESKLQKINYINVKVDEVDLLLFELYCIWNNFPFQPNGEKPSSSSGTHPAR